MKKPMMKSNMMTKAARRVTAVAALLGVSAWAGAALAYTYAGSNGTYQVCAQTLYLRNAPSGPAIDTLPYGSYFKVTSSAGGNWVYGHSYWTGKSGWVQNGWFC